VCFLACNHVVNSPCSSFGRRIRRRKNKIKIKSKRKVEGKKNFFSLLHTIIIELVDTNCSTTSLRHSCRLLLLPSVIVVVCCCCYHNCYLSPLPSIIVTIHYHPLSIAVDVHRPSQLLSVVCRSHNRRPLESSFAICSPFVAIHGRLS